MTDTPAERIPMSWPFVARRIAGSRSYWICTCRPDHRPRAAPVWRVWHAGRLFFGTSPSSVKARNLDRFEVASFHLESGDFVVSLEGTAAVERDPDLLREVTRLYNDKYALQDTGGPVVKAEAAGAPDAGWRAITPRVGFTWLEAAFAQTMTRWEFGTVGAEPAPVSISYG